MSRFWTTTALGLLTFVVLTGVTPMTARAQYYVSPQPPVTVSYYPPAVAVPTTTYYAPAPAVVAPPVAYTYSRSYYSAPVYSVPTVAYSAPVAVYSAPAPVYYGPTAVSTTYYRPGIFRPRYVTRTAYYAPVYVP